MCYTRSVKIVWVSSGSSTRRWITWGLGGIKMCKRIIRMSWRNLSLCVSCCGVTSIKPVPVLLAPSSVSQFGLGSAAASFEWTPRQVGWIWSGLDGLLTASGIWCQLPSHPLFSTRSLILMVASRQDTKRGCYGSLRAWMRRFVTSSH